MRKSDIQLLLKTHTEDFKFRNHSYKMIPNHIYEAMMKDYNEFKS